MPYRYEIRLAGSGGQGLILAGIVLADAVGVYEGRHVAQTQSYGPEARGGASKSEVVISDEEIDYPKALQPNILLAMNQQSCDLYYSDLATNGLLVVDSTFVKQWPYPTAVAIPFTQIAREHFNREFIANMIALGTLTRLASLSSIKSMEKAIVSRVPPGSEELNLEAFRLGLAAAKKFPKIEPPWKSRRT